MSKRGSFSSDLSRTGRPSRTTRSAGFTLCPRAARAPLTVMRPDAIAASMARREPSPERARTLCSFSAGPGGLDGAGLGRLCGFVRRRLRGGCGDLREVKRLCDVFQRRQLFERAQTEVVEKCLGGRVERRMPGDFLVPDHLDPVALLET